MKKILLSVYACEPGTGSEPGIGWNLACQAARANEVWVLTRENNRKAIERRLAEDSIPSLHWVYCELPRWMRFWKKGRWGIRVYYWFWQLHVYFVAKRLHDDIGFDLVHHGSFGAYWMPSFLVFLPLPLVWGPVGGGESAPRNFRSSFSFRGRSHEWLRDLARNLVRFDPVIRLAARRAACALATTADTRDKLHALGCDHVSILSNVALPADEMERLGRLPCRNDDCFRALSIGDLLHWKGFELGLRAFAQFHALFPRSEYWIIGQGPERKRLERLARSMLIEQNVKFLGALPRSQVLEKLSSCDVLLHPSLHDSGGWVCLEAMASARPVICLDLGGPAFLVTEDTGIKVPAVSPTQAVGDIAKALGQLAGNRDLLKRRGRAARQRAQQYLTWDRKGCYINQVYESVAPVIDLRERLARTEAC